MDWPHRFRPLRRYPYRLYIERDNEEPPRYHLAHYTEAHRWISIADDDELAILDAEARELAEIIHRNGEDFFTGFDVYLMKYEREAI